MKKNLLVFLDKENNFFKKVVSR